MDPTYVPFRQSLELDGFASVFQAFLTANRLACKLPFPANHIDADWDLSGYDGLDVL
jgi:hypothetical protein